MSWVAWLAARLLQLVAVVLLTQTLSLEDLGGLFAALAAGALGASLAMGGLGDATTRQASAGGAAAFGTGDLRRALRRFAAVLPIVMLVIAGIATKTSGGFDWLLLVAGVLLAATQGATTILASVFRARGQAGRFALLTGLITNFGRAAVAGLALAAGLSGTFVLLTFVALNLIVLALTWVEVTRDLPPSESAVEGELSLYLGGAAWSLLANLDVIVVGLLLGADAAGTYGALMRIAEFSAQFLVAISVLYLPEATRLAVANRKDALAALYRATCRWSAITSLLVAGTGFIAADEIARLLFGDAASAATLLRILFIGYAIHGALGSNYGTLVALGEYHAIRVIALVLLVLAPALTVGFIEVWGVTGAAWATVACYVLLNGYLTVRLKLTFGVTPFDGRYARALLVCVGSWIAAALAVRALGSLGDAAVLGAAGTAALLTCVALLPSFGAVSPAELDRIGRLGRRRSTATTS